MDNLQIVPARLQANKLDRRTLDGREYAVAPVVAMIAGVRNGELVVVDELAAFVAAWDGRPIPLRHPQDNAGNYITANAPAVIEQQVLGQFFNARMEGDRLAGEVWLDVGKAALLGGDALATLNRLERGEVVEVSTAYFCDIEDATGIFNGEVYSGIHRNLRPDHIALLPDEIGSCSVRDGCGANRVNRVNVEFSQSIMAAFYLREEDAKALALADGALPAGSEVLPPAELHVTLAYLGEIQDSGTEFNRVAAVLADYAAGQVVVLAEVAGMGRFANAEAGLDAVFLLLDSEGLHQFRFWLAELLQWDLGMELSRRWGYVPHVTLGYVPTTSEVQLSPVTRRPLIFDRLALSWGEQTVVFPLRGEAVAANAVAVNCRCSEENMNEQEEKQAKATKVAPKANESEADAGEQAAAEGQAAAVASPAAPTLPAELTELAQAIRDFGGVQPLMDAVRGIKANTERQKGTLVARLAANTRCAFGKAELEAMTLDQLTKLEASIAPRSYVGQNGAMAEISADADELRVFKGSEPAKATESA